MLIWEQYDKDTWGAEWLAIKRLALVKAMGDGSYTCLVGTTSEMEWMGTAGELSHAQALCMRYLLLANNCEPDKVKRLSFKL